MIMCKVYRMTERREGVGRGGREGEKNVEAYRDGYTCTGRIGERWEEGELSCFSSLPPIQDE